MTTPEGDLGIKDDFPILKRTIDGRALTYLDNAATSLKPYSVIDAQARYYAEVGGSIHRGKHFLSEEASADFEATRARTGRFFGVPAHEIVFTQNTSAGLNLLASGLHLTPADTVVTTLDAHHSALLPWRLHGAQVMSARVDADGRVDVPDFSRLAQTLRPRVVVIVACSNVTGRYADLETMVAAARESGAFVVIDAAQAAPHRRFNDPSMLDADAFVLSAHKMLGSTGIGVLRGNERLFEYLSPNAAGGGAVDWVDEHEFRFRKAPHRFETGTPDIAATYGLSAALDYLEDLGMEEVERHDARLSAELCLQASSRNYIKVLGGTDPEDRAAILSMELRGCPVLNDVARSLSDSHGVMCRSGHLCAQPLVDSQSNGEVLRISAYIYNTVEDIRTAFDALDDVYRIFRRG